MGRLLYAYGKLMAGGAELNACVETIAKRPDPS